MDPAVQVLPSLLSFKALAIRVPALEKNWTIAIPLSGSNAIFLYLLLAELVPIVRLPSPVTVVLVKSPEPSPLGVFAIVEEVIPASWPLLFITTADPALIFSAALEDISGAALIDVHVALAPLPPEVNTWPDVP